MLPFGGSESHVSHSVCGDEETVVVIAFGCLTWTPNHLAKWWRWGRGRRQGEDDWYRL